jgi:hypothetical protein
VRVVVEVGGWEHECCGPSYERGETVEVICLDLSGPHPSSTRFVASHHDLTTGHGVVTIRGRVADVGILHPDGSVEALLRLPGGRALRGFGDDDGLLERPGNGQPVVADSDRFLVTLLT